MNKKDAPRTADRSLPRKSLVMVAYPGEIARLPEPKLPASYYFRYYESGDAVKWAKLMTTVEEFDDEAAGLQSFTNMFMSEEDALRQRQTFVISSDGSVAATSMAWWFEEGGQRYGRLHWVATHPDYQNLGLGRAVVTWGMRRTAELEPGRNVYLDTQTWSHKAIGLYLRLGFHPVRKSYPILSNANEYDETLKILQNVLSPETLQLFLDRSVE